MEMERTQIVTYNSHYLSCSKDAFMTRLSQQLYGAGSAGGAQGDAWDRVNEAMGKLHEAGLDVDLKDLDAALAHKKQRAAQHEDGLLDLIAGTLAYYKVGEDKGRSVSLVCACLSGCLRGAHAVRHAPANGCVCHCFISLCPPCFAACWQSLSALCMPPGLFKARD